MHGCGAGKRPDHTHMVLNRDWMRLPRIDPIQPVPRPGSSPSDKNDPSLVRLRTTRTEVAVRGAWFWGMRGRFLLLSMVSRMQVAWGRTLGIAVDSHVHRIAGRLGWTRGAKTAEAFATDPDFDFGKTGGEFQAEGAATESAFGSLGHE